MSARAHIGPIHIGEWWACEQPEQEITDWTVFQADCEPCRIALDALAQRDPLCAVDVQCTDTIGLQLAVEYKR